MSRSNQRAQRIEFGRRLEAAGGWIILAALVVGPWFYGSTRSDGIWLLGGLLCLATAIGSAGFLLKGRLPRVPPICWGAAILLAGLGWALVPRAASHVLSDSSFQTVAWHLGRWPNSTTLRSPVAVALLTSGLLGAMILAADLSRYRFWRRRILATMALTGASIGLLGLIQAFTGAESIFWQADYGDLRDVMPGHFFATFFHHSIAGAYLNLAWPAAAGLFLLGSFGGRSPFRWLWGLCAAVILIAVFVNVSKAAVIFAVLMLLVFLVWPGRALMTTLSGRHKTGLAGLALAVLVVTGAVLVQTGRLELALDRWEAFAGTVTRLPSEIDQRGGEIPVDGEYDRIGAFVVGYRMLEQSGFLGFGPASWIRTFPEFTGDLSFAPFWLWMQFAHQDYLQFAVEWGVAGAFLAAVLLVGGLWRGWKVFWRDRWDIWGSDALLLFPVLIALAFLMLHALGDFPLQIPAIQLQAVLLLGLAWSAPEWKDRSASPSARPVRRPAGKRDRGIRPRTETDRALAEASADRLHTPRPSR